jgi:hypothetical protein
VGGIPVIHVVHPADVVPALGGAVLTTPGTTWVAHPPDESVGIEAHLAKSYRGTAQNIDRLGDPALTSLEDRIKSAGPGTAMWFAPATAAGTTE